MSAYSCGFASAHARIACAHARASARATPRARRFAVERLSAARADRVVGVDDERGEQVVAAREVAVHRRGHHADLAGDGPQRQGRRALLGQVAAGDGLDLLGELGPGPVPGGAGAVGRRGHGRSVPDSESSGNESRALLLTSGPRGPRWASESSALASHRRRDPPCSRARRRPPPAPATSSRAGSPATSSTARRVADPLGISVLGSRELRVRGRTTGEWRKTPGEPAAPRRRPVPRRPAGPHAVGPQPPGRRHRRAARRPPGRGVPRRRGRRRRQGRRSSATTCAAGRWKSACSSTASAPTRPTPSSPPSPLGYPVFHIAE